MVWIASSLHAASCFKLGASAALMPCIPTPRQELARQQGEHREDMLHMVHAYATVQAMTAERSLEVRPVGARPCHALPLIDNWGVGTQMRLVASVPKTAQKGRVCTFGLVWLPSS